MSWIIKYTRQINIIVVGLLLVSLLGILLSGTAYAAGQNEVELLVEQEFTIANGTPPSDVFSYKLVARTNDAPMPAGSTVNGFDFTIVGNGDKEIGAITFAQPGIFVYQLSCITVNRTNYTIDNKVYRIEVHVSASLDLATVAFNDKNGFKVGELSFAHRYNEPQTPTPPSPTPTPPTPTPPPSTPQPPAPPTTTPPPATTTPPTTRPPDTSTPTDPPNTPETTTPEEEATIDTPDFTEEEAVSDESDIPQDSIIDDSGDLDPVDDGQPPLVVVQSPRRAWALLNLILSILGALAAIVTTIYVIIKHKREDNDKDEALDNVEDYRRTAIEHNQSEDDIQEENDEEERKKRVRKISFIAMYIMAILAIILFILTQDIRLPMIFIDKWTIIHIILAIIEIVAIVTVRRKNNHDDENENDDDDNLSDDDNDEEIILRVTHW